MNSITDSIFIPYENIKKLNFELRCIEAHTRELEVEKCFKNKGTTYPYSHSEENAVR